MNRPRLLVRRLRPRARIPARATPLATGLDLYACLESPLTVGPDPVLVPAGIALEAPPGFDLQIRPRSGLASKGVLATFGTVDADYRGEIFVTLYTIGGREPHVVKDGDRIAQLVVSRVELMDPAEVDELSPTERGDRGHGSTGDR
jgi:dUTP pyrophosphatase